MKYNTINFWLSTFYRLLIKEKQGFEPWVQKLYDRLAIYCFRPLSHFSEIKKIMELIKAVFPYASPEIVSAAVICFFMTLFGLSLGFALLKVQGE